MTARRSTPAPKREHAAARRPAPTPPRHRPGAHAALQDLQRSAGNAAVHASLAIRGSARSDVERRVGGPLPDARLHTGPGAAEVLVRERALGVARGRDVFLPPGLDVESEAGRTLVAHELAHVLQQTGSGSNGAATGLEAEAAAAGGRSGGPVTGGAPFGVVQKQAVAQELPPWLVDEWVGEIHERGGWRKHAADPLGQRFLRENSYVRDVVLANDPAFKEWLAGQEGAPAPKTFPSGGGEGAALAAALAGRDRSAREVHDALLERNDPTFVLEMMQSGHMTDALLDQLGASADGRRLLDLVYDSLAKGATSVRQHAPGFVPMGGLVPGTTGGADAAGEADRVMAARMRQVPAAQALEGQERSDIKIFPYNPVRLSTPWVANTPIYARRTDKGKLAVQTHPHTPGWYREDAKTLPPQIFTSEVEIDENEIIGIRRYDRGGAVQYVPAVYLLHLELEDTLTALGKAKTAWGLGLAVGGGGVTGPSESAGRLAGALGASEKVAGTVAKVVGAADTAALAAGVLLEVANEHRYEIGQFMGEDFLKDVDRLNSMLATYGEARLVVDGAGLLLGMRDRFVLWRQRRAQTKKPLTPQEQALIARLDEETARLAAAARESQSTKPTTGEAKKGDASEGAQQQKQQQKAETTPLFPDVDPAESQRIVAQLLGETKKFPKADLKMPEIHIEGNVEPAPKTKRRGAKKARAAEKERLRALEEEERSYGDPIAERRGREALKEERQQARREEREDVTAFKRSELDPLPVVREQPAVPQAHADVTTKETLGTAAAAGGAKAGQTKAKKKKGKTKPQFAFRQHRSETEVGVQPGHRVSEHRIKQTGEPDTLALEDADINQRTNWTVEGKFKKGEKLWIAGKDTIEIQGAIVDRESALVWARSGRFPRLTEEMVKTAPSHPGWVAPKKMTSGGAKARFMGEQAAIIAADPNHPLRPLLRTQ